MERPSALNLRTAGTPPLTLWRGAPLSSHILGHATHVRFYKRGCQEKYLPLEKRRDGDLRDTLRWFPLPGGHQFILDSISGWGRRPDPRCTGRAAGAQHPAGYAPACSKTRHCAGQKGRTTRPGGPGPKLAFYSAGRTSTKLLYLGIIEVPTWSDWVYCLICFWIEHDYALAGRTDV
jgi:hypothetical protein